MGPYTRALVRAESLSACICESAIQLNFLNTISTFIKWVKVHDTGIFSFIRCMNLFIITRIYMTPMQFTLFSGRLCVLYRECDNMKCSFSLLSFWIWILHAHTHARAHSILNFVRIYASKIWIYIILIKIN